MNGARDDHARQLASTLEQVEYTLSHRDENVSENMAKAIRGIVAVRDQLIDAKRSGNAFPSLPGLLDHVNGLISLTASLEFPLAGFHWKRVEEIRDNLRKM